MRYRLPSLAVLVATLLAAAAPASAQKRGTMELGAFGAASSFDQDLLLYSAVGVGGRVGMYLTPRLSVEFEQTWMRATRPLGLKDVNLAILASRLTGVAYSRDRFSLIVGAGAGISTETNFLHAFGVDVLGGAKYALSEKMAIRVDGVVDWLSDQSWKTYGSVRVGFTYYRHP